MTREEASIIVGNIPINGDGCYSIPEYQQAKAIAIEVLEQQPCEDAVSRQAVLDVMKKHWLSGTVAHSVIDEIRLGVKALPSVTPKEKTGHWIYKLEDWNKWTCSECGFTKRTDVHIRLGYNYCPNCGARVVSE